MNQHIVLLGDSIFDNQAYTSGGPDVITHLKAILPEAWRATLLAVDGDTTNDIPEKVDRIPPDATQLVISVGGNDALGDLPTLQTQVGSVTEALDVMSERTSQFEIDYRNAISSVLNKNLPTTICTIYYGNFPDALSKKITRQALTAYNDAIIRIALDHRLPIIDLRLVCTDPDDYFNPIEPNGQGGKKIALAIAHAVGASASSTRRSVIWGGE
jgi:hypothetical protein